jgi:small GTP-binding protein
MGEIAPRVITLGDSGVGKTSLVHRMKTGEFLSDTAPTIGAGVTAVDVEVNHVAYPLQIWDTAGQEMYRSIIPIYFRGAVFAILVFSMVDLRSFEGLNSWLEEITANADPDIGIVLVGSKFDCEDRTVASDTAQKYADNHKIPLFFTSSLTGQNVTALVEYVALAQAEKKLSADKRKGIDVAEQNKKKRVCC